MQRYNIFYQIHKGLRQMLYHTASHLQQTDFIQPDETTEIIAQIHEVLDLFDGHANTEDNFVLPSVETAEPAAANLFEEEHVQDHALSNKLRALLNMFHHTVASEEKLELGSAIRVAFTEFLVFNLQHMAKEELQLNHILWQHHTDDQLQGLTQKIIAHIPQELHIKYNTWMMRGLSNNEIVAWLKNIKNMAPEIVFNGMLKLAEAELNVHRWSIVQEDITEGALLAS